MPSLKKNRPVNRPVSDINVVPYIDVMLVLLVIFMITTPLLTQGVHVKLPKAQAKTIKMEKDLPVIVSVNQQGQYFLNTGKQSNKPINAQQLMSRINTLLTTAKKSHKTRDIYVKGDRNANYGKVVGAMVLLQKAGAKQVGLITESIKNST